MKAKNPHAQGVIKICNKFQKGLFMNEENFIEELKQSVRMIDIFSGSKKANVIKPLEEKKYYMRKIKGVDGFRWYYVEDPEDIKFLGTLNSKYTGDLQAFKKNLRENYCIEPKIIYLDKKGRSGALCDRCHEVKPCKRFRVHPLNQEKIAPICEECVSFMVRHYYER